MEGIPSPVLGDRLPSVTTFIGGCGGEGVCDRPGFLGGIGGGFPLSTLVTVGDFKPICGWPIRPGKGPPSEAEWGKPGLKVEVCGLVNLERTCVTVWRACCLAAKLSRFVGDKSLDGGLWVVVPFCSCSVGEA